MNTPTPSNNPQLQSLLRRGDIWRGDSRRFVTQKSLDSGYGEINAALINGGWPLGALVEVCQPSLYGYSEWLLLAPALLQLNSGYMVLLNPPALPFAQGLLQMGLDLNRLVVVQSHNKAAFLKSFVDLAHTETCKALLAWQPNQNLSYTDLRKCLLAASHSSLSVLFRHSRARQQSSPASLRLHCQLQQQLELEIFKQKGVFIKNNRPITVPLPEHLRPNQNHIWQPSHPLPHLQETS